MQNRLKLDFSLESAQDRVDFINSYIVQFDDLTSTEASKIADYLLWGKKEDGVALGADTELPTKWTKTNDVESLDAVLENPAMANTQLYSLDDAVMYKKERNVFDREEAKRQAPKDILDTYERLWKTIDTIELETNFYELKTGKREKPPRDQLLKRFTEKEVETIKARAQNLTQYQYLKLRHQIKELRTEQYTIRDAYRPTLNIARTSYAPKDRSVVFDCDVEVFPLGVKEGDVGEIIFDRELNPELLSEDQLKMVSNLVWGKKEKENLEVKFDFRDLESVYQLYLFKEDLVDRSEQAEYDHLVDNNTRKLLDTLDFYEEMADLTDIQREILELKEKKKRNLDIASYINKKYGKSYTANYISTIFRQKIIVKINEAAALHKDTIENCFFPENFKRCSDCGRILLLDPRNWVRKARSKDGFKNKCKRCEREQRKVHKLK